MKNVNLSQFYLHLQKEVEKELLGLLKKFKIYPQITLEQLKKAVYHCPLEEEMNVFDPFLRKAREVNPTLTQEQLLDLNMFLHNQFWNVSPIKFLGGKSPLQLAEEKIAQNPKQNIVHHPIFFGITLPFKIMAEAAISQIKDKNQKIKFIGALPLIFKRYWHSPMIKGKGDSSPFLTFLNMSNFYVPNTDFYFFPFYEKKGIGFQGLPIEEKNWDLFPIIFDLKAKGKSYFYAFDDYRFIVDRLKKIRLSLSFSFFSYFIDFLLLNWKRLDPILKDLSDKEWFTVWRKFLSQAAVDVVDTEGAIYPIILLLKEKGIKVNFILQWMAQWPHVQKKKDLSAEEKAQDFFFFKLITDFDRFFITPLTLSLPVFNLLYAEKSDFEVEIEMFFQLKSDFVFYKPPTKLTFNDFGRRLFKKYY